MDNNDDKHETTFQRLMVTTFSLVVIVQLALGTYRARMNNASVRPAVALAAIFTLVALLWFARRRRLPGAGLARPAALLFATLGVVSGFSAFNAPFLGFFAAFSTPLFALSAAAVLAVAELSPKAHIAPVLAFLLSVAALEVALTRDARWEARLESRHSPLVQTNRR